MHKVLRRHQEQILKLERLHNEDQRLKEAAHAHTVKTRAMYLSEAS